MKHLYLIHIILFALLFLNTKAQDKDKLMNWKTEFTVRSYLLQKMHDQYNLRRAEINNALKSREDMLAYRDECRNKYMSLLGDIPEKTPLNPQITKTHKKDGYTVENVIFESYPGHHVTTNFYLPEGDKPFPAALLFCGHEMTSKATESYQRTAILFALNGFAVLVVDPISQGERVQFTDEDGNRILRGSTTEHTLLNAGANLTGNNVVTYELIDNIRSLDYLISRPEINSERIGVLGNSGGGAQTAYFVGFDKRVKVAASCSNIARRERNYELDGTGDGCQQLAFEGNKQLEIGDFLIMFAPKPVLILAGRYDFVNYTGTKETYDELKLVYSVLGKSEKIGLFTVDDGHGISKPKREAAVSWFLQWLCNDRSVVIEPELAVSAEEETYCTRKGQVNEMFPEELTIQQYNLIQEDKLRDNRNRFIKESKLEEVKNKIKELLVIDNSIFKINSELIGEENTYNFSLKKYILRVDGEIPLPCLFYFPTEISRDAEVEVYLFEEGKTILANNDSLINSTIKKGNILVLSDLRGMGETREREDANEWKYYNCEYHNAIISLHLGKPITGQRVRDIFTLLDFISFDDSLKDFSVTIKTSGSAGPVALYASLFREQVKSITQINSIKTYKTILEKPMELDWYSYVIPDVLKYFDLPDLLSLRSDLKVTYKGEKVSNKKAYQR